MICVNDLHLEAARLLAEILGRELSADERPLADLIGERAGEVAQDADLDRIARNLGRARFAIPNFNWEGKQPFGKSSLTKGSTP